MQKLGIVTPHYNNLEGVKKIYNSLLNQTSQSWEWVIVDDFSGKLLQDELNEYFKDCLNVFVVNNNFKSNASKCRNIGVDSIKTNNIVFLDSDDLITEDFIKNRLIKVKDFTVYLNCIIISTLTGKQQPFSIIKNDFLDNFLKAKFAWQTSCVLWNKSFLISIGKFNEELKILQDVELSIRSLYLSNDYTVFTENKVDFFYLVEPINTKKRTIKKVSEAVEKLTTSIYSDYILEDYKIRYLSNYYYLLVKYFCKSSYNNKDLFFLKKTLKTIRSNKIINYKKFYIGQLLLVFFSLKIINSSFLLKANRKIFKIT
jgi:glycosyltransferase involved in cell wall biosynthesis